MQLGRLGRGPGEASWRCRATVPWAAALAADGAAAADHAVARNEDGQRVRGACRRGGAYRFRIACGCCDGRTAGGCPGGAPRGRSSWARIWAGR